MIRNIKVFIRSAFEKLGERRFEQGREAVQKLDFFHSLYLGSTAHYCAQWKSSDNVFHIDAPIAIVVTRNGRVSGIVGFEIIGSTMLVRQLQGAPRGHFHDGTPAEEYLLSCAEGIASALGFKTLRIVTSETAIAYRNVAPATDRPSDVAVVHMKKMYGYPAKVGYPTKYFWRVRRPTFYKVLT